MTTVTDAVYNPISNTYSFSGKSNHVWSLFDDGSDKEMVNDLERMKPTALFLGHVGVEIFTSYGKKDGMGSGASEINMLDFINSSCGIKMKFSTFDYLRLTTDLKSGLPAVGVSGGYLTENNINKPGGHAYLIDFAETVNYDIYEVYAYVSSSSITPPVISPSDPIDNPYGPSLSYYRAKYGSIDSFHNSTNTERWIKMNWGWHGMNNDVLINADLSSWIISRFSNSMNIDDYITFNSNLITVIE